MARPTIYSDELVDGIMEAMVERAITLTEACAEASIHRNTWYAWLLKNEAFRKRYDACQENLAYRLADECQHIAKSRKGDLGWARLHCDVLWRRVQKLNPRKYGTAGYIMDGQSAPAPTATPLTPLEVADAVSQLLADTERQMGIASPPGATDAERAKAIADSGQVMPPAFYEIWSKAIFDGQRH
jgi:hypothetical protein